VSQPSAASALTNNKQKELKGIHREEEAGIGLLPQHTQGAVWKRPLFTPPIISFMIINGYCKKLIHCIVPIYMD